MRREPLNNKLIILLGMLVTSMILLSCSPNDQPSSSVISSNNISSYLGNNSSKSSLNSSSINSSSSSVNSSSESKSSVSSSNSSSASLISSSSISSSVSSSSSSYVSSNSSVSSSNSSSISSSINEENILETEVNKVEFSIDDISNKYLSDLSKEDINVTGFDSSLYKVGFTYSSNTEENKIIITYQLISLYSQKRSSNKEKEIIGFKEETLGSIISSLQYVSLDEKTNISLTISLSHYSSKEQTVSLSLDNTYCLINKTELTFSSSHKQEEVVISASHLNTDFEDHISKLTLSSEGTEDKTIQIQINNIDELTYSDISISEESLVLKENQAQILYISLKDKPVINQTVTLTINNNYCSIDDDSLIFTPDNYSSSQEVKVTSNIKGEDIENQTSIISLSSGTVRKSISVSYEKPSTIKEEILTPFVSGFIIQPVNYYTAYYDVDYTIQNMQVKFNNDEWRSLDLNYDSFTNNACMIEIPYKYQGTKPTI